MPCGSIWRFSTMPRLARRHRSCRSLSRPPIRLLAERERMAGSRLLRLLHQLPDRPEARRHRRCGSDHCRPPGRGDGAATDDRSHAGAVWPVAGAAGGRRCLRLLPRTPRPGWCMSAGSSRTCSTNQRTDGTYSRDDFTYDHKRGCYICPAGKKLRQRQKIYRVPRPFHRRERHDALSTPASWIARTVR